MALLLHCSCISEIRHCGFMDVPEACSGRHHLPVHSFSPLLCSWQLGSERFLPLTPYTCRQSPHGKIFRFTLCTEHHNTFGRSPVMSTKRGKSSNLEGVCKVVWTIEADLAPDQLLYITGDPSVLGSWEPEMAVRMSPTDHENLWKADIKVACGVNFKYTYFIRGETWSSSDIIWKPGPEFSLSVPLVIKQNKKITVRDSWMRFDTKRPPAYVWGSWIEDNYFPLQPLILAPARDEDEIVKCLKSDFIESNLSSIDLISNDDLYSGNEDSTSATHTSPGSHELLTELDQPVEEPWLLQSPLQFLMPEDDMEPELLKFDDTIEDDVRPLDVHDQRLQDTRDLLPEEEETSMSKDPVSTVILINSSICTMQRIAVLEDGKLVELLLEPVKSNVQCDSVYLGVVTKLVPHMGGAFVNIGSSRPSLMDIKHNREPFIFPPFRQRIKKQVINGSVSGTFEGHIRSPENENTTDDVEIIDDATYVECHDGPEHSTQIDYDEQELVDDFDVSEVFRKSLNGSIVDYDEAHADFEDYLDGQEHELDAETRSSSLPSVINGSNISEISRLQDRKDSMQPTTNENKWVKVRKGTKVVVQVVKEGLGTKGPTLTAYPKLRSRFWILMTRCDRIGVSKKVSGVERTRLKVIAKTLQPKGFGLTVRTVAAGHSLEELQKDLEGLIVTWKNIIEHAKSAALAADEGVEGAIPVILHRAMGQTLSVVQDYFNEKVQRMVVDSPRTYHEVTNYLQEMAPDLCDRVELYNIRVPLFDEFNVEEEINNILSKRVPLANGGSLVIEQTEALVSIDVNGGHGMFGHGTSQEKAILEVNLAAARQIARELRLRDIGGIIVVDFIDMEDDSNKRLVYEEVKKAVERDRSMVKVSELSRHGLMEITRKRVRPSVTFMISEPCTCCHATGRVEALETSFSKIEQEICRLVVKMDQKPDPENPKSWPKFILRVDHHMCDYLTSGKRTRLAILSSSLKVWIILKVARGFTRGAFEVKPFTDDKSNKHQHVTIPMLKPTDGRSKTSGKKVTLYPIKRWKPSGR